MWSSLVKLLRGSILAIALLVGGGVAMALYLINKVSTPPAKPIFANDKKVKAQRPPSSTTDTQTVSVDKPNTTPSPLQTIAPKPLEPGAYQARVTWPQGLLLRSEPNFEAERIGGVGYNQQIVVLEESLDKSWQRVRPEDSEQAGWIRAGNTERIEQE